MEIRNPCKTDLPGLRSLWQTAFGDTDDFLDCFFRTAYAPDRCRCIFQGETLAAVLYWLDCRLKGEKYAYIYAVATHPACRGRGLCRTLMADTHALLKDSGYAGAVLVPQKESLRAMYAGMGYSDFGGLEEMTCEAGDIPYVLRTVGPEEFAALRRNQIPEMGILQEDENLRFLSQQMQFYAGEDLLMAAWAENDVLHAAEYLGSREKIPGILKTLNFPRGSFRMPGSTIPFAMFHPLRENAPRPEYFGFAFD